MARETVGVMAEEVDLCNVEGEAAKENTRTIKVDFQVAAVKKPLISGKRMCEKRKSGVFWTRRQRQLWGEYQNE